MRELCTDSVTANHNAPFGSDRNERASELKFLDSSKFDQTEKRKDGKTETRKYGKRKDGKYDISVDMNN